MCGRYQLQASAPAISASYRNAPWRQGQGARFHPRQQLRPTNRAPVVVAKRQRSAASGLEPEITIMKWGITPVWSNQQSSQTLINARRETLLKLPTFRNALLRKDGSRRCAVPSTGFYEWHKSPAPGKPTLTPYLVQRSRPSREVLQDDDQAGQDVVYMAGIYESAGSTNDGEEEYGFVIITTEACKQFAWLHDRQPVFLSSSEHVDAWLDYGVAPDQAVSDLRTESGLVWTRMVKDLSGVATGKTMVQKGLDSFFGKSSSKQTLDTSVHKTDGPRKPKHGSPRLTGGVRKREKQGRASGRGVQKTLGSYFAKGSRPS